MQRAIDSRIQAKVRILLARRWVDLRSVTIGTTNGVVYIGGRLRASGGGAGPGLEAAEEPDASGAGRWLGRIRREITEIPEVRDVVFQLEGAESAGGRWNPESA